MENKSHALAAGIFVLLMSALLVLTAVWLTRDTRALHIFELSGRVNVTGLQPQASVRLRGVPVGKVTAILLDPQVPGQVLVRIAVDEQTPISTATVATLGFQGVTGLAFIQLDDGSESAATLPITALATNTAQPSRIPLKQGLVSRLTDQGERLLGQLEQSTQRLNQLLSAANQQTLMSAVDHIGKAAADLQQLSGQARQSLPQLVQKSSEALDLVKDTSVRVGISAEETRISARAFRLVNERMYSPGGMLDQIENGSNVLVATGQALRVGTLPRVNQTVLEAAVATHQLGELTQALTDNPQSLLLGKPGLPPGPGEPGFVVPVR